VTLALAPTGDALTLALVVGRVRLVCLWRLLEAFHMEATLAKLFIWKQHEDQSGEWSKIRTMVYRKKWK
jgi:hypothetical protein